MSRLQSKSLIGDQSIVFSPPSIIKETLCDEKSFSFNDAFTFPKSPSISAIKVRLSLLVCFFSDSMPLTYILGHLSCLGAEFLLHNYIHLSAL